MLVNGKPCGRNELIADFIYQETGKVRDRKQVSSHIQVLKNTRKNDPDCKSFRLASFFFVCGCTCTLYVRFVQPELTMETPILFVCDTNSYEVVVG